MIEKIVLIGGGGHCKSVIDSIISAGNFEIAGIIDIEKNVGMSVNGIPIIGTDEDLESLFTEGINNAFITLGSIKPGSIRQKIVNKAAEIGYKFPVIIDKSAIISDFSTIFEGSFIGKGVIINTNAMIGQHCIINSGSIIEHDVNIGGFVHVAPGVTLSGSVIVGNNTHLGTNTTVIQGITIGNDTLIGAGSVVVKDISNGVKAYGNPCREADYE